MIVLIGLIAFGFVYSQEGYKDLDVFSEVYSYVRQAYVDPAKTDSKELIYGAINGMLQSLNDPFTRFMTPQAHKDMETELSGSFGGLGIVISVKDDGRLVVVSPIEDTPAYRMGIKADDWITHIEGTSTQGITIQEAVNKLRGPKGTQVTITITRRAEPNPLLFTITRDIIKVKSVKAEMIEDRIAYIRITGFNNNTVEELNEALKGILNLNPEYLILDLRNNGGGTLQASVGVSGRFLSPNTLVVYTKGREGTPQIRYVAENGVKVKSKMIILINGGTASGAEILAGALKDHKRGILVGKKTFGKASVQTVYNLSDGSGLALTTAHYYTPAGNLIHNKGIEPDIVVEDEALTEEKRKAIEKFEDSDLTEDFVKNKPVSTNKDIDEFIANIKKQGFDLERKYILRDIEKETREFKEEKPSIVDRFCDPQLARAIELIKTSQFFKE